MRITEITTESTNVPFPVPEVNPEKAMAIGSGTAVAARGSYYTDYLVPTATSEKRDRAVFAGIQQLCAQHGAEIDTSQGGVQVTYQGMQILDLNFDTARTLDGRLQHSIGMEWAWRGESPKGFITSIMAYIYDALDQLHGKGDRVLEVNDDRSAGVWGEIAQKLGAYYSFSHTW
jgi:hypothetical protein